MKDIEIREIIINIFKKIDPDQPYETINDNIPLIEQLTIDSIDYLDVIMELGRQYEIMLDPEELQKTPHFITINNMIVYLKPYFNAWEYRNNKGK